MLVDMNDIEDPWTNGLAHEIPPVVLVYMPMKIDNSVIDVWNERKAAA